MNIKNRTKNIKAEIVAHSRNIETGDELITYRLTYPRIILAQLNTYKQITKITASSRAQPFNKVVEVIENDPFIPMAYQKAHKGMQGTEYFIDEEEIRERDLEWLTARDKAVEQAKKLNDLGVTKQLTNRLLESFMWVTQLVTGTREAYEHLFNQRCPEYEVGGVKGRSKKEMGLDFTDEEWLLSNKGHAEIHFMDLAEKMYDALRDSEPKELKPGELHVPYLDTPLMTPDLFPEDVIKYSCGLTAHTSYTTIGDGTKMTIEKARGLFDHCLENGHYSVFEMIGRAMSKDELDDPRRRGFRGFIQLRGHLEDGNDLKSFLS
jgi:N4 gp30-like protein